MNTVFLIALMTSINRFFHLLKLEQHPPFKIEIFNFIYTAIGFSVIYGVISLIVFIFQKLL